MNYGNLPKKQLRKVIELINLINNIEISPAIRQMNMERLLQTIGLAAYTKVYEMNAWDMLVSHTTGKGIDNRHYGLAKIAAAAPVTNPELEALLLNYLQSVVAKAQDDARVTAKESGKSPTVTRKTVGETCNWCIGLAGTYTDPDPEVFARHTDCDCEIWTEGYNSRNGLLQNYKKRAEA